MPDDYTYLMGYPVTSDCVEEWLQALSEVIVGQAGAPDEYRGRHQSNES